MPGRVDGYGYGSGSGYGYGDGDGYGDGSGSGCGYGYGYGDGDGDGYGDGSGEKLASCGGHVVSVYRPFGWLRIGCEIHSIADWIANAEEIDAKHGDGIWRETSALARVLAAAEGGN